MTDNRRDLPVKGREGLVNEVIADFLGRLRGQPHMNEALLHALESLSQEGMLKDASAVHRALRIENGKSNATS